LKEQFGKEPSTVRCLAVKSALLGTRHPRKEKEAALQTVTGKPACLDGKILISTQSEKKPSVKMAIFDKKLRLENGVRSALCRSRRELSNEHLLAKIGVDTAENEPFEVWVKIFNIIHLRP